MPRPINYNAFKGNIDDLEDLLLDEVEIPKVQKIKKKKKFDDGTTLKDVPKKIKVIVRETEKE